MMKDLDSHRILFEIQRTRRAIIIKEEVLEEIGMRIRNTIKNI